MPEAAKCKVSRGVCKEKTNKQQKIKRKKEKKKKERKKEQQKKEVILEPPSLPVVWTNWVHHQLLGAGEWPNLKCHKCIIPRAKVKWKRFGLFNVRGQ